MQVDKLNSTGTLTAKERPVYCVLNINSTEFVSHNYYHIIVIIININNTFAYFVLALASPQQGRVF